MSGEAFQRPKVQFEKGHTPGRAVQDAREIFQFTPAAIIELVVIPGPRTADTFESYNKLLAKLSKKLNLLSINAGSHLIEAVRNSRYKKTNGSYEVAGDYYKVRTDIHDIVHVAVAYELNGDPRPSFFSAPSQIENWKLIQEEMHALLLWKFHVSCHLQDKSFETTLTEFFEQWKLEFLSAYRDEALKENRDEERLKRSESFFGDAYRRFRENPDAAFMARARRIYDGMQRGECDFALKELYATLKKIPPHP